jgi:hypothetical protein
VSQDEAIEQLVAIVGGHSRQCMRVIANADVCTCDAPTPIDTPHDTE